MPEDTKVHDEVREQTVGYIAGALGLVAGLAWNDAIKGLIEYLIPLPGGGLWAKFIYALIITLVVVLVTRKMLKVAKKN